MQQEMAVRVPLADYLGHFEQLIGDRTDQRFGAKTDWQSWR